MKKIIGILLLAAFVLNMAAVGAMAETYSANAVGNNGRVYVDVQVEDGKIAAIDVDVNYETPGLGEAAAKKVAAAIVEGQTLVVDAVAGATFSSNAVLNAVEAAITEAGLDVAAYKTPANPELYNQVLEAKEADIVVVGGGMAGMTAAVRAAQAGAKVIMVEKSGVLGGAAPYAMGWISGAGFKVQKELALKIVRSCSIPISSASPAAKKL